MTFVTVYIKIGFTFKTLVKLKIWVQFVDGIVSEVHEFILEIVTSRRHIRFCSKSCQSLLIDKYSQRICACNQDINPHVKLEPVNKKGFVQISLNNTPFTFES